MNLVLSLTERCNLRCTYCYYKVSHEARSLVMSSDIMEAAIRLAFGRTLSLNQRFLNITFFGGEPLLCMDSIRRGVELAKGLVHERFGEDVLLGPPTSNTTSPKFRLRFAVNTNATLLNEDIIEYLKREKFRIYLSLDGPEAHHNICRKQVGGEGSFKLIEPHIPALTKLDTVVLSVITRENMHSLSEAARWIQAQGFRNMTAAVDFDGKWTGEEFDVLAAEYEKLAEFWLELKRKNVPFYLGTIQDKLKFRLTGQRHRTSSCQVAEGIVACAANGNLFPCTRFITSKPEAPTFWAMSLTTQRKSGTERWPAISWTSSVATRKTARVVPYVSAAMRTNAPARHSILQGISTGCHPRCARTNACSPQYATMPFVIKVIT